MNDVVGHVVVAIGDEDLGALDAIRAIGRALGAGAQRADVGAGLRLGELHGAGPFAGDELLQIDLLQLVAAMGVGRLDRAERQQRAKAEGHVGCAPDFSAGGVDRHRQALAAEAFRPRHRVPSARDPALIRVGPAGGGGDFGATELDAVFVADTIERRQHVAGEFTGFLQHGRCDVAVEIAVMAGLHGGLKACTVIEREQDVGDRRAVGHDGHLALTENRGCRLPTKPAFPQLSDRRYRAAPDPADASWAIKAAGRRNREVTLYKGSGLRWPISREIRVVSLLKWPNSLYRPALPDGRRDQRSRAFRSGLLGRSQAGRQGICIPPFGGSIPPAPASQSLNWR